MKEEYMADDWYVGIKGQQQGPFSKVTLSEMFARGEINRQDLVKGEGMPAWKAIETVPELKDVLAAAPQADNSAPGKPITVKLAIPCIYDDAENFHEGLAPVRRGSASTGKWGFIDKAGKEVLPCIYENVHHFSEGLAPVALNGKWGFIDKTGKEGIPFIYRYAHSFSEGLAAVDDYDDNLNIHMIVEPSGEYGFFYENRYHFIDKTGKKIISCRPHNVVDNFSEGLALVGKGGDLKVDYGFIDKTGKDVVSCFYDAANSFHEGLASVRFYGKWKFIDKTGEKVLPPPRRIIDAASLVSVEVDGKVKIINKPEKEIIYEGAGNFSDGMAPVQIDGKWSFIDKTGKEVLPCPYEDVKSFTEGLAPVQRKGKWGFIDKAGTEVVPCIYDDAKNFHEGLACVRQGDLYTGKWGFLSKGG